MGRTPLFDHATVVRAARDVFWAQGFEATSIADLERATGLGRSSLYHGFGSKRGLFDAVLDDYLDTVIRPRLRLLRAGPAGDGLLRYLASLQAAIEALPHDAARRGCLLVNCAAGFAGHDEPAREVVTAYWAELAAALRDALAAADGPDGEPDRIDQRARTLAGLSTSALLLARVDKAEPLAMLSAAGDLVRSWFPAAVLPASAMPAADGAALAASP